MSPSGRANCVTRIRCRKHILTRSCSRDRSRLLNTLSSFVLSRSNHSTYPHRVRLVVRAPCGLVGKCFEQACRGGINDQRLTVAITPFALGRVGPPAIYVG